MFNAAAGTMDGRRTMPLRLSSSAGSTPSPSSVTTAAVQSDPTTNNDSEQSPVKRTISNIERTAVSTDRRSRQVGIEATDSSSDLLEFLAAGDTGLGSGEFVRSGSQRIRRRSRLTMDAPNNSRERVTPPPATSSPRPVSADNDDLPPSLSRSGPGRWSLRERVSSRGTPSPPLSASARLTKYMANQAPQEGDSPSLRPSSVSRGISDHTATGTESLLERADNSLEERRRARLQQLSASPATSNSDLDERRPKTTVPTSYRLARWSPTVTDVSESSAALSGNQLMDQTTSHRRWSLCDVERAINEVEKTGKEIENVVSGVASDANRTDKPKENGHRTTSDRQQVVTPDRLGSKCAENETRRWGRIFDNDDEEEPAYFQRSATLPRRWRWENPGRQTSNTEDRMEKITESPPTQQNSPRSPVLPGRDSAASDSSATGKPDYSGNFESVGASPRRTLPNIPARVSIDTPTSTPLVSDTREPEQPAQSSVSPPTVTDETAGTSRPTSSEFDDVSESGSSRDEGFESAVDNGGQSARSSAWSYQDVDVTLADQSPTCRQELVVGDKQTVASGATTPCDGDDLVSSGTSFFARSIDSLVLPHQELVISGETIDIDHLDAENSTNLRETQSIVEGTVPVHKPSNGSNQKSGNSKSSFLAGLTARLSRPKKSTLSGQQTESSTGKLNGAGAKQPVSSGAAVARNAGTSSAKSSAFVRDNLLRATMPASLRSIRTRKSTPSSAVSRDSLQAPEPPVRTTSIRDSSIRTAPRPGPVTSRQSTGIRKPQGDVTTKPEKQSTQQSAALPSRGRVAAQEQSKDRDKTRLTGTEVRGGRDKLVLYKVDKTTKSPGSSALSSATSRNQAANSNNGAQHRTQRLVSFNTPQQSRTFRF